MEYISKTQHYLKVKKPLLERQRRARMNKCLDSIKHIIANLQNDESILRMDKAEMLEATVVHLKQTKFKYYQDEQQVSADGFRNGYLNAANEVSRVLASTRKMSPQLGKAVMTHLGCQFSLLRPLHHHQSGADNKKINKVPNLTVSLTPSPVSPASSGYHSDMGSPAASPAPSEKICKRIWRPW